MSESPSRLTSRAVSMASSKMGSVATSRAASQYTSAQTSRATSRAVSQYTSAQTSRTGSAEGSMANSTVTSAVHSPSQSRPESPGLAASSGQATTDSKAVSAAGSKATSVNASKVASGATSASISRGASPSGASRDKVKIPEKGKAKAKGNGAAKPEEPQQEKEKKQLKSRKQWDKEQRERMQKEVLAEQRRQQAHAAELTDRIKVCDAEYARLKAEGNAVEALQWLERGVWMRRDRDGVGSEEVERAAQTLVGDCNIVGMALLQAKDLVGAHEALQKGLLLTAPAGGEGSVSGLVRHEARRRMLRAVTYNNLGCFYRTRRKLHSALQMLDKALRLELLSEHVDTPATTHLNMSVVLSQLHKHRAALEHAQCAVELLQDVSDPRGIAGLVQALEKPPPALLAVACHNMASQLEFLNDFDAALLMYGEAAKVAARVWGETHGKTLKMHADCQAASERMFPRAQDPEEEMRRKRKEKDARDKRRRAAAGLDEEEGNMEGGGLTVSREGGAPGQPQQERA